MKTLQPLRFIARQASVWLLVPALAAGLCAGCATTQQVKSIVAESNAAMLAAQLPDVGLASDPAANVKLPDPAAVSKKIDDFIAAHPDQKVAASALRVRQAILLIVHGKYELARAAFAEATDLKTDRDKALKAVSESIIWWWQHSAVDQWTSPVRAEARQHLAKLDGEIAKVQQSPDIRDYLAETRARLGLQLAKKLQIAEGKRDVFMDTLNHYGAIFTPDDVTALRDGNLSPQSLAISVAEKRRLRALAVIETAKEPAQVLRTGGHAVTVADLKPDDGIQGLGRLVLGP